MDKNRLGFILFLIAISLTTAVLFWQVFLKNQIPFSANLLASFFNPWAQEKFPGWEVGIPNRPVGKDDLWIFYPQRTFTDRMLIKEEIPFWNPYSFSGNYHAGLSETAVFYPLNVLFLFFSQVDTWVFLILIQPVVVGIGMFLYLQRIIDHKKSAAIGAFAFAFCGIVLVRSVEGLSVGHTLIWMPYVFWGIEAFSQTKKIRYLLVILFSFSFSLLAGWLQYTFYIVVFSFFYILFKFFFDSKNSSKFTFLILLPFVLFPFITLFHIIPASQAFLDSPRSDVSGSVFSIRHLVGINHLPTLIFPDFWGNPSVFNYMGKGDYKDSMVFVGVIPILLSLFSVFNFKMNKKTYFFFGAIGVSLLFAIDTFFSRAVLSLGIPIFSSFLPNRIFLITTFSFCVLASFGFDFLLSGKKEIIGKIVRNVFGGIWIAVLIIAILVAVPVLKDPSVLNRMEGGINRSIEVIQLKSLFIPLALLAVTTVLFFLFRRNYTKNIFFLSVIGILCLQSFLFGQKYIPFSYREFVYPSHPVFSYLTKHQNLDRFMSIGYGHIVPSIPLQFYLYSPEGIGSMYIKRYGEFVSFMKGEDVKIPDKIAFDLEIYPQDVFYPKNARLHRFYELTSVKYIVVDKKSLIESKSIPDKNKFSKIWEDNTWFIYRYNNAMPRFFLTSNFKVIKNDDGILKSLFGNNFILNQIILEENPGFASLESTGSAKIIVYSPNKIVAEVDSKNPSIFYISDNYSKQFRVFVDGKEGKLLRANYTFRAVPIPKGEHKVEMVYDDRPFFLALKIAAVLFAFLIATTIIVRKYV